ncbi:MAG: glycosyltransferase family 4 protein [Candidatus Poseidoniaceae archaeon]
MSKTDEILNSSNEENLIFTVEQINYLREEFERQRRWVNLLANREQKMLSELEQTQNSISYKIGRMLTWAPRTIGKKITKGKKQATSNFVKSDEEEEEEELFPSSLLISPELLPSDSKMRKADNLVEGILIAIRRGALSVEATRDLVSEESFTMNGDEVFLACQKIMSHLINSREYQPNINNVYVGILRALVRRKDAHALEFGEMFYDEIRDQRAARTLIQIHGKSGNFLRPIELLKTLPRSSWKSEQLDRFKNASKVYSNGFQIKLKKVPRLQSKPGVVLYHASQSRPHTSSGYAIRTHGLVSALKNHGVDIKVCLRQGYPLDRSDFIDNEVQLTTTIENVEYNFSPISRAKSSLINYQEVYNFNRFEDYMHQAVALLIKSAQEMRPEVIHSGSNFVVGMAGAKAAKALGIPSIYEIRGFWHLTQSTKREGYESSDHFNLSERLEIETAKESDYVFTITNALKEILVENGVEEHKISVLPNAVELGKFNVRKKNKKLETSLGFKDKIVIGYIGSFVNYEGLNLLLEACAILHKKLGDVFRVLLVGDGAMMNSLRKTARFLQLEDIIRFTGRVDHDEVEDYYSLIDIAPLPRIGHQVCELVSPLKPFEAMSSGKVLITSSVKALAEIVDHGNTGLVFEKDNSTDLAEKLESVIVDHELRLNLGANARAWVERHHSWENVSKLVLEVYKKIKESKI